MGKHTDQVNVRLDEQEQRMLAALRKHADTLKIPTASDIMRAALLEKFERDIGGVKRTTR